MGATDETMVDAEDPSPSCCGPHVFTSILLGVLACVLMTGGVFLAFHRWDPLWLIVSGVGVILVLIGSLLHCCGNSRRRPQGAKGCCLPDHHLHNHVLLNGGSLTEQLLPLSNARSVSQLSLNMLPGYFPPMVTTYGIEQHSAVVQNINRIIQQQTQQSPVESPGKNFILLSLPGNTPQANIQNLVATVYQLDGSVLAETTNSTDVPPSPPPANLPVASSAAQCHTPVLKSVEVQTCAVWPESNLAKPSTSASPSTSNATSAPNSTQTDGNAMAINLMDCSTEPICDIPCYSAPNEMNIPAVLGNVSQIAEHESNQTSLTNTSDSSIDTLLEIVPERVPPSSAERPTDVLVDIEQSADSIPEDNNLCTEQISLTSVENDLVTNEESTTAVVPLSEASASSGSATTSASGAQDSTNNRTESVATPTNEGLDIVEDLESSSLSLVDLDDSDSEGRSSPPPSYDDVASQRENPVPVGVFGLAYGTL